MPLFRCSSRVRLVSLDVLLSEFYRLLPSLRPLSCPWLAKGYQRLRYVLIGHTLLPRCVLGLVYISRGNLRLGRYSLRHVSLLHMLPLQLEHLGSSSLLVSIEVKSISCPVDVESVLVPGSLVNRVCAKELLSVLGFERQLVQVALYFLWRSHKLLTPLCRSLVNQGSRYLP